MRRLLPVYQIGRSFFPLVVKRWWKRSVGKRTGLSRDRDGVGRISIARKGDRWRRCALRMGGRRVRDNGSGDQQVQVRRICGVRCQRPTAGFAVSSYLLIVGSVRARQLGEAG
eukprot:4386086-Pleurochrysis_carterae.AAC.1